MNTDKNIWRALTLPVNDDMHDALQQQHYAAQFIALVGRHLLPQQSDDSNTNMRYCSSKKLLQGNPLLNGYTLGLHLDSIELHLLDNDLAPINIISLEGKTWAQSFDQLKQNLEKAGVEVSKLSDQLHYELPTHPLASGSVFKIKDKKNFEENMFYRQNAEIVLNEVIANYESAEPVRIWPHHFDTGSLIPLSYNAEEKLTRSLGLGWAIPDSMVDEPYFYLSLWSEKPIKDFTELPAPESGEWIRTGWTGGVLRLSEILKSPSSEVQYEKAKLFFQSGIEILTSRYK